MTDRCDGRVTIGERRFEFEVRAGDDWGFVYRLGEVGGKHWTSQGTCPDFLEAFDCLIRDLMTLRGEPT